MKGNAVFYFLTLAVLAMKHMPCEGLESGDYSGDVPMDCDEIERASGSGSGSGSGEEIVSEMVELVDDAFDDATTSIIVGNGVDACYRIADLALDLARPEMRCALDYFVLCRMRSCFAGDLGSVATYLTEIFDIDIGRDISLEDIIHDIKPSDDDWSPAALEFVFCLKYNAEDIKKIQKMIDGTVKAAENDLKAGNVNNAISRIMNLRGQLSFSDAKEVTLAIRGMAIGSEVRFAVLLYLDGKINPDKKAVALLGLNGIVVTGTNDEKANKQAFINALIDDLEDK